MSEHHAEHIKPDDTKLAEQANTQSHRPTDEQERGRRVAGVVLISVGTIIFIQQTLDINLWRYAGPAALIIIGAILITRKV